MSLCTKVRGEGGGGLNKPLVCHSWVKNAVSGNLSAWGMHLLFYLLGSTNLCTAQCDLAGTAHICVVMTASVAITITNHSMSKYT